MIITRTPLRVSFLGGGTDYPEHFRLHGGRTLVTAIDKFSYITLNRIPPLFDHVIRVSYSRTELAKRVADIEHPSVRECLRFTGIGGGLEVNYVGELPARTGLGSSSAFTVGLLHALHALKGELVSTEQLAAEAVHVEQVMIRERVGVQDQYACAVGGLSQIDIQRDGTVTVRPVPASAERLRALESHLMLFYTGVARHAHAVLEEQVQRTQTGQNTGELQRLAELVDQGVELLTGEKSIEAFGELLHDAWTTKKRLSTQVTTAAVNQAYDRARAAGAGGGKLLGAGGGGFLLLFAVPASQTAIERALAPLTRVPIGFERSGSTLLFYRPS